MDDIAGMDIGGELCCVESEINLINWLKSRLLV